MRKDLFGSTKEGLKKVFDTYKAKEPGSLMSQFTNRRSRDEAIRHQAQRKEIITELFPSGIVHFINV